MLHMIWPHSLPDLQNFLTELNDLHPTIKFTHEHNLNELTFLDLELYKTPISDTTCKLSSRTHFKPTNSFQYINYHSFHPFATKKGTLKGELTRIHRTTSDPHERLQKQTFLTKQFKARGYPDSLTSNILNQVTRPSPAPPNTDKTRPILVTTYSNISKQTNSLLLHEWTTHITSTELTSLFPNPPMLAFKKNTNLHNTLVHSSSPGSVPDGPLTFRTLKHPLSTRVHPCRHPLCKCCNQLIDVHHLANTTLTQHLNCRSRNVVYLIKCRHHHLAIYIGQTTGQLNQRLTAHRGVLSKPGSKSKWPLYKHFLSTGHSPEDIFLHTLLPIYIPHTQPN